MTTAIIRTYSKNEHVAMKCYESMKALNVADKYCFFVERGGAIPNIVATYIENEPDIIDMFIMSKCKNHIIANSTFSWWSAWLSGNKTIAPKNFFVDGYTWPGMYKEDWILI